MDTNAVFGVSEEKAAAMLGVGRNILKQFRDCGELKPEVDWVLRRPGGICYRKEALTRVLGLLGADRSEPAPENRSEVNVLSEQVGLGLEDEVEVVSCPNPRGGWYHYPNRRIIRGKKADGEVVLVKVRDSRRWRPGDRVPVFHDGMIWVQDTTRRTA